MADNRLIFAATGLTQGRVFWRGAWSSIVVYQTNDAVSYNGNSYIALASSLNVLPSVTTSWDIMASGNAVTSVSGRVGAVTLSSADLTDKDAASGVAGLDSSAFLKAAEFNTTINAQVGTTYAIAAGDRGKLITFSNASPVAVSIAQATGSFAAGWYAEIQNIGVGLVTITPATSTVEGSATVTLKQWESIVLTSAGGNYVCLRSKVRIAAADLPGGTTGSGAVVLATSPTLVTPALGVATATSVAINTAALLTGASLQVGSGSSLANYQGAALGVLLPTGTGSSWIELAENSVSGTAFRISKDSTTGIVLNANVKDIGFLGSGYGTTIAGCAVVIKTTGQLQINTAGQGIRFTGATSGNTTVIPTAVAGSTTLTLPAATDTLVGKATTDIFTNKSIGAGGLAGLTLGVTRFTASGTFTIPTGVTSVRCRVVGGGGAGGGTSGTGSVNGVGGSSGGYGEKILTGLTPGNTFTITIGAGGTGVSNGTGNSGGTTTVASGTQTITSIIANGGNGGLVNGQPLAGASAGSGGDSNFGGSPGQTGFSVNIGGNGAGATFAGGGAAGLQGAGNAALAPGAGGGGAGGNAGSASAGGAGAAGIVIFEYVT
jgi:hypothetical protein